MTSQNAPEIRTREQHRISRQQIDVDALKALYRLIRNGYTAYLVGGSVRDLLLNRIPKDFDIATNATPTEIRQLFRNCILIGRRFVLAHLRYGEKIIETSTFRRNPQLDMNTDSNNEEISSDNKSNLLQVADNTFGTAEEDAVRRDFTVNGLFYNPDTFEVIDYVGGLADLDRHLIRSIGDPEIRFCEDPIRMIRAVRLASRLNFQIEADTLAALIRNRNEMQKASPARLLEEIYRLFGFGSGQKAIRLLYDTKLMEVVLPEITEYLNHQAAQGIDLCSFWKTLEALDRGDFTTNEAGPALRLAVLIYDMLRLHDQLNNSGIPMRHVFSERALELGRSFANRLHVPFKTKQRLAHILTNQARFYDPYRNAETTAERFVLQESFGEALSLCEIFAQASGQGYEQLSVWRKLYYARQDHALGGNERERRNNIPIPAKTARALEEAYLQNKYMAEANQSADSNNDILVAYNFEQLNINSGHTEQHTASEQYSAGFIPSDEISKKKKKRRRKRKDRYSDNSLDIAGLTSEIVASLQEMQNEATNSRAATEISANIEASVNTKEPANLTPEADLTPIATEEASVQKEPAQSSALPEVESPAPVESAEEEIIPARKEPKRRLTQTRRYPANPSPARRNLQTDLVTEKNTEPEAASKKSLSPATSIAAAATAEKSPTTLVTTESTTAVKSPITAPVTAETTAEKSPITAPVTAESIVIESPAASDKPVSTVDKPAKPVKKTTRKTTAVKTDSADTAESEKKTRSRATKKTAETASVSKPVAKPKTATKSTAKATAKVVKESTDATEQVTSGSKVEAVPVVAKPVTKPVEKPVAKPDTKPAEKTTAKPTEKPATKPAEKPVSKTPAQQPQKQSGQTKPKTVRRLVDKSPSDENSMPHWLDEVDFND